MFFKYFVGFLLLWNISSSLFVEAADEAEWVDYRLSSIVRISPLKADAPVCTSPGRICSANCKDIYVCLGNNESLLATTCTGNETCNNGACSTTPSSECSTEAQKSFICKSEGILPDPFDCRGYHICVRGSSGSFVDNGRSCGGQQFYNPRTTYCDRKLVGGKCSGYPVPVCKTPGQTGAIQGNPSIYYICLIYDEGSSTANPTPNGEVLLYPYLFICQDGKSYDGNYNCK